MKSIDNTKFSDSDHTQIVRDHFKTITKALGGLPLMPEDQTNYGQALTSHQSPCILSQNPDQTPSTEIRDSGIFSLSGRTVDSRFEMPYQVGE